MRLITALALVPALGGCAVIDRVTSFVLNDRSAFELQQACQREPRGPSEWRACQGAKAARVAQRYEEETFDGYDVIIVDGEMAVDAQGNVIVFDYPTY